MPSSLPPSSPPSPSSSPVPQAVPQDGSDPFGFFALERTLKERRVKRLPLADLPVPHPPHHHNPPLPRTPRKPHRKRAVSPFPEGPHSDSTPSVTGTPSPAKAPLKKPNPARGIAVKAKEPTALVSLVCNDLGSSPQKAPIRRSRRQKALKPSSSQPQRAGAARRAARLARKSLDLDKAIQNENTEFPPQQSIKKTAVVPGRRKRGQRNEPESKSKPVNKGAGHVDEEQEEKWARERQDRLDYFKKLDSYQIAKENVYVI